VKLNNRKAQMEMIGLVVIVILITLGMLFLAQFALKESPKKKIFTRKGLAYSTMSAIMKTSVIEPTCFVDYVGEASLRIGKDILEDCARHADSSPFGYSLYECKGKHSCIFLNETVNKLLNSTLGKWNKRYEFKSQLISFREAEPVVLIRLGEGCPKSRERDSSGLFPINTEAGLVENVLYLCD